MLPGVVELATYLRQDVDPAAAVQALAFADGLVRATVGFPAPDPWPAALDAVVVRVAGRLYANPRDVQSESIGSRQVTFGQGAGQSVLTAEERAWCARLGRRSGVYSVALSTPADLNVYPEDEVPTL